jgi:GNAT superfamily N-acetyltransferase
MSILVPFQRLTERQLAEVVAIYEAYFAVPWEWPAETIHGLGRAPGGPIQGLAALDGEAPAGLTIGHYLPAGRLWYIPYLAIRPDLHGQGWGSRILEESLRAGEAAARARGHPGCIGALLEVEAIDGAPGSAEREERVRRQAFYRRHGALMTGAACPRFPWAPPEMPHFDLMFIPMSAWDGRVTNALRHNLIRSLMVEAYAVPQDAPWLLAALAPFDGVDTGS